MNKVLQLILISVFFTFSSMRCDNGTLSVAQELDIRVTPNPIPVSNGQAEFSSEMSLPDSKSLRKIDSLVFDFIAQDSDQDEILGTSVFNPDQVKTVKHFKLNDFQATKQTTLYIQMRMYHKGHFKTSDRLPIGLFSTSETSDNKH